MPAYLLRFDHPTERYDLVIDHDGRVIYGYLRREENIIGDVWIGNAAPAPTQPPWKDAKVEMPFLNPRPYAPSVAMADLDPADWRARWLKPKGQPGSVAVRVFHGEVLMAVLSSHQKPGWSRLAEVEGPLAKRLEDCPY